MTTQCLFDDLTGCAMSRSGGATAAICYDTDNSKLRWINMEGR